MKLTVLPILAIALLVTPAFAQVETREGIALQNQISELRRDIDDMRNNAPRGGGGSSLGSSRRNAPVEESGPAGGGMTPELLERISRLEDSVRQINGRLDELANTQSRSQADLAKQISDLQFRLDNGGAAAPASAAAGATTKPATPAPVVAPPVAPAAAPRSADQLIQEGNAALARRDYASAEADARQVLAVKGSPKAYDAQMLLAQSLSGQRKPVDAALAYGDLYQRNKQGAHAQDALVGLASSQITLGDNRSACVALDSLKSQYPTPRQDIATRAASLRTSAACR
jgi:TolA-binding protein